MNDEIMINGDGDICQKNTFYAKCGKFIKSRYDIQKARLALCSYKIQRYLVI